MEIETHPFKPFLPHDALLLMSGTFPPRKEKWAMDFYYPNYINDIWRIFGLIFYNDKEKFFDPIAKKINSEAIKKLLIKKRIAQAGTAYKVIREKGNAADKHLKIVETYDLKKLLLEIPLCTSIATTGEKAASVIAELTDTKVPAMGESVPLTFDFGNGNVRNLNHWRMPSTSRAYPMKLEEKAFYYKEMFIKTGILP